MTVKELKNILSGMDDNLEVLVADYDDDSNEETVFRIPSGCEKLQVSSKSIASIYFQEYKLATGTGPVSSCLPCSLSEDNSRVEPIKP